MHPGPPVSCRWPFYFDGRSLSGTVTVAGGRSNGVVVEKGGKPGRYPAPIPQASYKHKKANSSGEELFAKYIELPFRAITIL